MLYLRVLRNTNLKWRIKMAYMNQETKKEKAPAIKAICKKYGVTASLAVRNHSTLVLNVRKGSIDFIENWAKARRNFTVIFFANFSRMVKVCNNRIV